MKIKQKSILTGVLVASLFLAASAFAATTSRLYPVADGSYTAWSPSTSTVHYTLVDEVGCNGLTDYVQASTSGMRDSYYISTSSIPVGSRITKIEIQPCASERITTASTSTLDVFYRINSATSSDAGAYTLTGTTPTNLATTSFSGLSYIETSTTSIQIGAVLTSGTNGARLSDISAMITYSALLAPTNLATSTATTSGQIIINWSDNTSAEDGYIVERGTDGTHWSQIGTTAANITTYTDPGLTLGVLYYYRVKAYNSAASSSYSNTTTSYPAGDM